MTDPENRATSPNTREPRFEDLETDEARTTSEEAMAPNAVAAAQGGSASPTSGGPAAIIPAAPGDVLNVGDDRGATDRSGDPTDQDRDADHRRDPSRLGSED
ncbi:MAG: hypothetical protein M3395_09385 [Chloroflexota bacterium]|nr:hypothetical protein [Chloroflexota bacterium]